jgi:GT2 family glycosyltransferase
MTTSIMMVTYNRLDFTKRMLDSFWKTTKGPFRLIIVDNGSTDGTRDFLEKMAESASSPVHLHFNSLNKGIAVGRNQGLLLADRYGPADELMCTIDNDVELPENWLQQCVDIISDNPRMAIGVSFESEDYQLVTRNKKTFQIKGKGNLGTACSVFSRELHKQIGFFTTDYGLYGEEDADWYFRARLVGWEMGYLQHKGTHFDEIIEAAEGYRDFKTASHKNNLVNFQRNCFAYMYRIKSNFIPYSGPSM